jgi:hypothetical protein
MKCTSVTVAMLIFLAGSASVMAEEETVSAEAPALTSTATETAVSATEAAKPANPAASHQMHEKGMMHKGKGGHGGMKRGCGQHGKGKHDKHAKHEQVVKRLDMIEARLAKIEAMLESLVRR